MMTYVMEGGPYFLVQLLVMIWLIWQFVCAFRRVLTKGKQVSDNFWEILVLAIAIALTGITAVIAGFMNSMAAILTATELSPHIVAQGVAIALRPGVWGIGILILSLVGWHILSMLNKRV